MISLLASHASTLMTREDQQIWLNRLISLRGNFRNAQGQYQLIYFSAYYTERSKYQESERKDYALMLSLTEAVKDAVRCL